MTYERIFPLFKKAKTPFRKERKKPIFLTKTPDFYNLRGRKLLRPIYTINCSDFGKFYPPETRSFHTDPVHSTPMISRENTVVTERDNIIFQTDDHLNLGGKSSDSTERC